MTTDPDQTTRRVVLVGIRHGAKERGHGDTIYGRLLDAETGDGLISATLDYILNAVRERGHILVPCLDQEQLS